MDITLRPLNLETDMVRFVELVNTTSPEPVTAVRVLEWESHFPSDGVRQRMVALDETSTIVGTNSASHVAHMLRQSFFVKVVVDPGFCRRGIGSQLYENAEAYARAQGATRLEAEVRDHQPDALRFAQKRGFEIDRHIFESTLDVGAFDESRFAGVIEAVQEQGIRFFTFADVRDTEENRRRLFELDRVNALDIPGSEGTFPRFKDFQKFVFEASWFRAAGQIFAAEGECWVGMTAVGYFKETNSIYTMHTGVLKEYRGRNIALALKLLSIRYARACGASYMRTNNDSKNAPILAVNQKLGYQPKPGWYRLLRNL